MRRIALLLVTGALLAPVHGFAGEPADTERARAQQEFRLAFDAGDYMQALAPAQRVVELTSSQFGAGAVELATPLTNLATTLLRMERLGEAHALYARAFEILGEQTHPADARRIAPLQGIATVLQASNRHEDAIVVLEEAVDLVRASEGLDSPAQFPLQWALVESHEKTRRLEEANRIRLHIFHTAERAFGADDVRMIGPLCDLAEWYEKSGHYSGARVIYLRAVQLADRHEPGSEQAIKPLHGVARLFRKQRLSAGRRQLLRAGYANEEARALGELPLSILRAGIPDFMAAHPDEGQWALEEALLRLAGTDKERALERGRLLVELGDLHRLLGSPSKAMAAWSEAWGELAHGGDTSLLDQPAILGKEQGRRRAVRPPLANREVLLQLSVTAAGDVDDVAVVEPQLERKRDQQLASWAPAYTLRPAFAAGKPVAMKDFVHREFIAIPLDWLRSGDSGK